MGGGVRGCGGVGGGVGLGGQSGCERRIEVFFLFFFWGGGPVGGVGSGGGQVWGVWLEGGGVRVDVNAMLGVGGDVGMGDVNQE